MSAFGGAVEEFPLVTGTFLQIVLPLLFTQLLLPLCELHVVGGSHRREVNLIDWASH